MRWAGAHQATDFKPSFAPRFRWVRVMGPAGRLSVFHQDRKAALVHACAGGAAGRCQQQCLRGTACAGLADADQSSSPAGLGINSKSAGCDIYECMPLLLRLEGIVIAGRQSTKVTSGIPKENMMINQK